MRRLKNVENRGFSVVTATEKPLLNAVIEL